MTAEQAQPGATDILIVDPRPVYRAGLRALLARRAGTRIVGEAGAAATGQALARKIMPHVAIVAEELPDGRGVELAWAFRREALATGVILQCAVGGPEWRLVESLQRGVAALLPEDASADELDAALDAARSGHVVVTLAALRRPAERVGDPAEAWAAAVTDCINRVPLSPHEQALLRLIVKGLTNAEIGQLLTFSPRAVEYHLTRVLRKLADHQLTTHHPDVLDLEPAHHDEATTAYAITVEK